MQGLISMFDKSSKFLNQEKGNNKYIKFREAIALLNN